MNAVSAKPSSLKSHDSCAGALSPLRPLQTILLKSVVTLLALLLAGIGVQAQTVTATVTTGSQPDSVAINPVSNNIYIANSAGVTVINGATNTASTISDANATNPFAIAINPVTNKIYVANQGSHNVSVFDGATNAYSNTLSAGTNPAAIAVNPVTNRVYVANADGTVTVINGASGSTQASVNTTVSAGTNPAAIAVNPITNLIYVVNQDSSPSFAGSVTVINGSSNSVVGSAISVGTKPVAIAVNAASNLIYVANNGSSNVTMINGSTGATATVPAGTNPAAIAVDTATSQIYVVNKSSSNVTVIKGGTNTTTTLSTGSNPVAVAINAITNQVYVANSAGSVTVINGATSSASATVSAASITTGTNPVAIGTNPVTNKIYVANAGSSNATVIDGATNVANNIGLNAGGAAFPFSVAVNPTNNKAYTANIGTGNVTVINLTTGTTTSLHVGGTPYAVTVNPITGKAYVANNSGWVTIISGSSDSIEASPSDPSASVPFAVAVNPVTNQIYVANNNSGNISVIDGTSDAVVGNIGVDRGPSALAVNPNTNRIYVANGGANSVSVVDGGSQAVIADIHDPNGLIPSGVAVNPVTNMIYVSNEGQFNNGVAVTNTASVTIINGSNNTFANVTTGTESWAVAVNPVTNKIYIPNKDGNNISVLDGATNAIATVTDPNAQHPYAAAVNSATNKIYIPNYDSNNITIIDGTTNKYLATASAGTNPAAVAVNAITNTAVFADYGSSSITVLAEQQTQTVPILANITALPNNTANSSNPIFTFTSSNSLTTGLNNLLFQVDALQGTWTSATNQGSGAFSGTTTTLQPGFHILYAYGTDGEESSSVNAGVQSSPLAGTISAYPFLVSASANAVTPTITWNNPASISYGTAISATQLNATAAYNSVTVPGTFAYTPSAGTVPNAGTQTLSVTFTPTDTNSYQTVTATVSLVVTQDTPTINWPTPTAITYGTPLSATQLNATASFGVNSVAGTFTYTPSAGLVLGPGTQTLSVTFTPTSNNFVGATANVSLVVNGSAAGGNAPTVTGTLTSGTTPNAIAANPLTNTIYVANSGANGTGNVTIVNGATNSVTTVSDPTGNSPSAIAVNPVTNQVYVANKASNNVTVINGLTGTYSSTITVGSQPDAIAVNSATNTIYVANGGSNGAGNVSVINGATNTISTVSDPSGNQPSAIAVNPVTNLIYATNKASNNVTVINGSSNTYSTTINAGTQPVAVAVNPVSNVIYIANTGSSNVTAINGSTNSATTVSDSNANSPISIAVNPVTNKIFVSNNGSGNVTIIDGATKGVITIAAGTNPEGVAINTLTNKAYVVNRIGTVTVIDGTSNTSTTANVGTSPAAVAVNPATNKIYVANTTSGNVTVLDGASNSIGVSPVSAGNGPQGIGANPVTGKVYVANFNTNNVTVIDTANNNGISTLGTAQFPYLVAINRVTNKAYIAGYTGVTVVNGATNATKTISFGTQLSALAVNEVTDKIYVTDYYGVVTVIDGSVDTVLTTVNAESHPASVAVNPVTNRVYVANNGSSDISVINGANDTIITPVGTGRAPDAVAVNSVTNKIYVSNFGASGTDGSITIIDGGTNSVAQTLSDSGTPIGVAVNEATNKIYVLNGAGSVLTIDGPTNNTASANVGTNPTSFAVDEANNKIFVANSSSNNVTVIDGLSNTTSTVSDPNVSSPQPDGIAINPVTNKVYVANYNGNNVTVVSEATYTAIPLTAGIGTLSSNQTTSLSPSFTFTPANTFTTESIANVLYQTDTRMSSWISATNQGSGNWGGITATLLPGFHIVYAYATAGEAATSTGSGLQNSPLIGSTSAYGFLVTPAAPNVSPTTVNFNNQAMSSTSAPVTLTLTNPPYNASLNFAISFSGTNAGDFSEASGDSCSTLGGVLAAGASCTINVVYSPSVKGAESATLTITNNGNPNTTETVALLGFGTGNQKATITWPTPGAITYGTGLGAQLNATATFNGSALAGAFVYTPPAGTVLGAGIQTLSVTFNPTDTLDYASVTQTVNITVNQAPLTVTAQSVSRQYGVSNPVFSANYSGFVNNETVAVLGTGLPTLSTTATTSSAVGSYAIVTGIGTLVDPNYSFLLVNGTLSVTPATTTITWASPSAITYGTALSSTQLSATASSNGISIPGTFSYTPASGVVLDAGVQTLSVTFTPTGATAADYSSATTTVQLTVNQATPTITWGVPNAISYGTALGGTQLDATLSVAGTPVYSPGSGTILQAGIQTLSVTFTPTNSTDYKTVSLTVPIVVNQVTPTITWNTPVAINYGTALGAVQLNATATLNGSPVSGTFAYNPPAGTVLGAGNQTLSLTFTPTDSVDYSVATASVILVVNPAVSTNQGAVIATVGIGATPAAVAVNPVTNKLYVANASGANAVTVVDGATNSTTSISDANATQPSAVAVNAVTNTVYVANKQSNNVTVINGSTNTYVATVPVGTTPTAIAVDPITNYIYVANAGSSNVSVINGSTNAVTNTLSAGAGPVALTVNPITNLIYALSKGTSPGFNGSVTVITGATGSTAAAVSTTVNVGTQPSSIAVNASANEVYVANTGSNNVTVINGGTNQTTTIQDPNGSGPIAVGINAGTNTVYVANSGASPAFAGSVSVFNGASNSLTTNIALGTDPTSLSVNEITNQIYVTNLGSNNLSVINGASNTASFLVTGQGPAAIAVNPVSDKIYVANSSSTNVTVVDGASNSIATFSSGTQPFALAVAPDTNKVYVANYGGDNVTVIGASNSTVTSGHEPYAVAVNPTNDKVYVLNNGSGNVTVIKTDNTTTTVGTGSVPTAVAINPTTNRVYVANNVDWNVSVIDSGTDTVVDTVSVGKFPGAIAVNAVTNKIYVANGGTNTITVINGTNDNANNVTVGNNPSALAVDPISNEIYVLNAGDKTVSIINGAVDTVVGVPIAVGNGPTAIAVNPLTNKIYVVNSASNTVTVIDGVTNATTALSVGKNPVTLSVNLTSNKIYVANFGDNDVSIIDGATNFITIAVDNQGSVIANSPTAIAINPITNQIYVANEYSNTVSAITEQQVELVPIKAAITALSGNQTTSTSPLFSFKATNTLTNGVVDGLFYQIDTWAGPWQEATNNGSGNFTGQTTPLTGGYHVLYAYATDGQESTSSIAGTESTPLVGNITAYAFIAAPPAGGSSGASVSPSSVNFGAQAQNTPSTAQTITLTNGPGSTLHFSVSISGNNPADFTEAADTCSALLGQLAANSNCSINIIFTPANKGAESAILTVTDDSNGVAGSTQTVSLSGTGTGNLKPTITWTPGALTYGQGLSSSQLNATAAFNGTTLTGSFVYTPTAGTILTTGAHTLSVTFTPSDTLDYTSATQSVQITVSPATLTVTSNASQQFGQVNPASLTPSYNGFVNGDTAAVLTGAPNISTTATGSSAVGNYPTTVTQGTLTAANYTFSFVAGTLTVTQATPTISWPTPAPILAGTALGSTQLNATASVNGTTLTGTFSYTPAIGAILNVGSQTLSVIFTPTGTGSGNYTTATTTVTLLVNQAQASFVALDTTTKGSWHGNYGSDGYAIEGDSQSIPAYASFGALNASTYTWAASTTDSRALQTGSGTSQIAATWFNSPTFTFDINLQDGHLHQVALYALDWDSFAGIRAETLQVTDAVTGAVLDTENLSNFTNGTYVSWNASGHIKVNVTITAGGTAVISGVFFGGGINPSDVVMAASQQQQFTAKVAGANNTNVTWAIANVTNPGNPAPGSISSTGLYTAPSAISGSQTVAVTAMAPNGPVVGTATVNLALLATASYVGNDSQSQGSWIGTYGGDGYAIPNGTQNLPTYAAFTVSGQSNYTWAASTTDVRAPETPGAAGRMASLWYNAPSFTMDVNLKDGNTHQVALYALDWDIAGRAEQIQVLDASTSTVLDTRSVTGFQSGQYLVWNINGHVKIVVATTNPNANAAISGVFFESSLIGVTVTPQGASVNPGQTQQFTAAVVGSPNKSVTWTISNASNPGNPAPGSISSSGLYTAPASVASAVNLTVSATASDNVTVGTATLSLAAGTAPSGPTVVYLGTDTTTQGSWIGTYGSDGYAIPNGTQSVPNYATLAVSGQSSYTWAGSTADVRAPQTPGGTGRMASVWYSTPSFTMDVNLKDGNTHQVALYALDWDPAGRAEQIQVLNASTNTVLDTRNVNAFQNGQYLVWNINGHVKIVVTTTNPNANAAISGVFFESSLIGVSVTPQSASLSGGQTQQYTAQVTGTPNKAVTWTISNASNPGNAAPGSISSSGLYTAPASVATAVNLTVTATASDNVTVGTAPLSLTAGTASSGATATYAGLDTTTQGSWIGTYGGDGYAIPNGAQNIPSYATFSVSGQSSYTWAASTTDVRAPQTPGGAGRMASLWFNAPSFTFDVNLKDGNTHQVALYALDWDGYQGGRAEQIQILDASTNNVLDTRTANAFQNGQYLVWNIKGHVKIVVTTTNPNANTAISGVFFESSLIGVSVTPQSASLSGGQTQQYTAQVTGTPNKAVTWTISNASNPGNAAPGSISSSGLYTAPASVASAVNLTVTATASDNVTVGTAPLSLTAGTASSGATATYAGLDTTTQGSWIGTYGGDGYAIPNGAQNVPSYATFSVSGQSSYTWAASTADMRAPQTPGGVGRMASVWFNAPSFTFDVNLKDGNTHQVALYALDWDGYQGGRAEQIQILDASTNNVLDTRTANAFQNGQYLVWNIKGHVKIVVTTTNPNANAAISGVFFESSLIGVSVTPQSASLSGGQTQQYTAQVTGTPNKAVTWTISNASNPGNAAPGSISSSGLYTAPASVASAVNLTVTATASDNVTVGTAPLSLTAGTASSGATATYAGLDTTTQGSWIGTYGGDGYAIPNGAQNVPSYATFSVSGQSSYTWAASTADMRAPQTPGGVGRMASVWFNAPSFTMDVNLKDGNTHQVALYALDWDPAGRAEQIQILDASTNNVLDTRTAAGFQNGQYLVWNINGHVKIVVTTTNPNANAAISGVFFESSLIGVSVTPQSASLSGGQTQQYTAQVTGTPNKAVTWTISNASNPGNAAPGSISSSGLYTAPASVASAVNLTVTATASDNVTVGTAPLSLTAGTASSGATATYAGLDTTTQGSWIGTYGGDGYAIPNGAQNVPSYATFSVSGQSSYTWAASTADMRAPQTPGGVGRMASVWFNAPSFTMDVNLKDGNTHQVALYALDWDPAGRAEQIQILDASTNNVLDTRTAAGFQNGQYLVWNINGHVKIVVTTTNPNTNAVISGIFFESTTVGVTMTPQSANLSPGQNQQFTAEVVGTPNKAVTWTISNASNPANPAPGTISSNGLYTAPATLATATTVTVTATSTADNTKAGTATISLAAGTVGSSSATFVRTDTTTQGNWQGVYGTDGYLLADGNQTPPSYATIAVQNAGSCVWSTNTTDPRALQNGNGTGRIAACWNENPFVNWTFSFEVNLTDNNVHQFAIYALDWDSAGGIRSEAVQIVDASTGTVLDTEYTTNFTNGLYFVWNISGHVIVNVTWRGGGASAVASGIFLQSAR